MVARYRPIDDFERFSSRIKKREIWPLCLTLNFLGIRASETEIYINIEDTIFQSETDEFCVKISETPEEIKAALEVGFKYECERDDEMFFTKRK